ncbi:MAG: tricarboxylate transporter, partial [Pseudomonadota bacterium]
PGGLWASLAWLAGLIVATWFVGFILALCGFLLAFFRWRAGLGWGRAFLLSACGIAFMCLMAGALNRDFPPGLLQSVADLPWPLT